MKKIIVLLVVLLLIASTIQVAFADPPPDDPDNIGSCHMVASWWDPLPGGGPAPGKADGVQEMVAEDYYTGDTIDGVQQRGMAMAHYNKANPNWPTNGAYHMDDITTAHCG